VLAASPPASRKRYCGAVLAGAPVTAGLQARPPRSWHRVRMGSAGSTPKRNGLRRPL